MGSSHAKLTKSFIHWRRVGLFLAGLVFTLSPARIPAQSAPSAPGGWRPANPFLEEEAPPALFDLQTGDADVELYLLGSWTAGSRLATGFAIHPRDESTGSRVTAPYTYPGFETELFAQTVDLTLSLWLYRQYFFEASFSDASDVNTIAAGYYADEDQLLRELVVGNVPLAIRPYPYQYRGSPEARAGAAPTPGAVVRLETAQTSHEFLLQLEQSQARRLRLAGGGVVSEQRLPAHAYLRGRRFVLPDGGIDSVVVLFSDPDGSVLAAGGTVGPRSYRVLDPTAGDYVIDRATGVLRVSRAVAESEGTLAVYYTTGGTAVGQPGAGGGALLPLDGQTLAPTEGSAVAFSFTGGDLFGAVTGGSVTGGPDMGDYRLPLADGRDALILSRPGLWSPFEAANVYRLPEDIAGDDVDGLRLELVHTGTRTPIDDAAAYTVRRIGSSDVVELTGRGAAVGGLAWRYPFATRTPRDANAAMYGPRAASEVPTSDVELLLSYRRDQQELILDGDVVPGTVSVTADGQPVGGVTFDPATGTLELPDSVSENAVVDVSYREYTRGGGGADIVAISGNRWQATPKLSLALAAGLRWTRATDSYSSQLDEHPGRVTVSTGATYAGESLLVDGAAALQVSQADTTGFMRLAGATELATTVTPNAETLFPAAADPGATSGQPLAPADRAPLRYRDYWSVDALGNVSLLPYGQTRSADADTTGGRVGPYVAVSTDDAYTGPVAVLEWDTVAPGAWIGAQIRLSAGETDLRDARTITIRYRVLPPVGDDTSNLPAGGTPQLTLAMGTLAEDLDADGLLDEGSSAVDPLLEFNSAAGLRRAGQDAPGLGGPHSEDGNGSGQLDPAVGSAITDSTIATSLATGGWRTATIELDAADRGRLSAVRGVRILLENTSGSDAIGAGRLLVGRVDVTRTAAATVTGRAGGTATVSVTEDPRAGTGTDLRDRYPVVRDRFVRDADTQRVFHMSWSGAATDGSPVSFETAIPDFSTNRYGTVTAYLSLEDSGSEIVGGGTDSQVVELSLSPYRGAPASQELRVTVPAAALTGGWHEVSVDTDSGTVSVDGGSVAGATASLPDGDDYLRLATLAVRGLSQGAVALDELHAADPRATFAAAARVDAAWTRTLDSGALAGTTLTLEQGVAAQGEGFRSADDGYGGSATPAAGDRSLRSTTLARVERGPVMTEVEATLRDDGGDGSGAFGHRVAVPLAPASAVTLSERFFRDYATAGPVAVRELSVGITGSPGRATVATDNRADDREIEQRWRATLAPVSVGITSLRLSGEASVLSLDRTLETGDYADSWLSSTRRFVPLPEAGLRQERRGRSDLGLEVGPWVLDAGGAFVGRSSVSGDQEDRLTLSSRLPLDLRPSGRRPWQVTPEYRRSWSLQRQATSGSLSGDLDGWLQSVTREPVALSTVPLMELFQDAGSVGLGSLRSGDLARNYTAEARLEFARAVGSRPRDLWVPSDVQAIVRRDRSWEADSLEDLRRWQLSLTAVAINLFGTQGSRPATDWFRSDEYRNGLVLSLDEPVPDGAPSWTIALEQQTTLYGTDDREASIDSSLTLDGANPRTTSVGTAAEYRWFVRRFPPLPALRRLENEPYYRHTERVSVDLSTEDGTFSGSEVTVGHRTSLVVGANGEISAYGDLGWIGDPAQYPSGTLHIIGIQLGIEGRLEY